MIEADEMTDEELECMRWMLRQIEVNRPGRGFQPLTCVELFALPACPKSVLEISENSYRHGLEDGFDFAIELIRRLSAAGFSRPHEIANILTNFSNRLTAYRHESDGHIHMLHGAKRPLFTHESWPDIRKRILRRDKACVRCGDVVGMEVDHIREVQHGGIPSDENLRVLCKACHATKFKWDV